MKFYTMELDQLSEEKNDQVYIMPFQQSDIELHDHNFLELAYVTGGNAIQNLAGKKERVKEGDYFIIDYGAVHSYPECKNFTLINCLFLPEAIDDVLEGCHSLEEMLRICMIRYYRKAFEQEKTANRIFHDKDGRVFKLLSVLQLEFSRKEFGWKEIFRSRLKEILILMMRSTISEHMGLDYKKIGNEDEMISDLIRYLHKNGNERAVLTHYCQTHHYSLSYVSRRFRQETGMTALQYLHKIRIDQSCALLVGNRLSIAEIAQAVGYEDAKYFSEIFKRMLGMTPGAYRRMATKQLTFA